MEKVWNVGIYARVSTDKKEQQESIPMQVEGLKKWLLDKSVSDRDSVYNLIQVYEDAGFSGSNFERESFAKMMEDIEQNKINMVLTRDLSRFARNYVAAGYYLEDYFKVNGVRFVSVLDNVDTLNEINDIIPFKNILNEMYIKDCSRRVRDGLKQRMLRGSNIASKPPYGYSSEEEHNGNIKTIKLIPANDETTEVVKEIYNLYLQGWGIGKITTYLNKKGIKSPSARLDNFGKSKFGIWNNNTVKYILTNPKYGGIMVQQRWKKISYKIKKTVAVPEDQWINGGEFEGIISKEIFKEVQRIIKKRAKNYRYKGEIKHPFSTVLVCNECGGSMSYRKGYEGYKCTNSQMGGGRCASHSIKERYLEETITRDLIKYVKKFVDEEKLYNDAKGLAYEKNEKGNQEIQRIEKELCKIDRQFEKIYLDKLNDVINQRNFEGIIRNIENQQKKLLERKEELTELKKKNDEAEDIYKMYKDKIDRILNFKEFDRIVVEGLIERIVISEDKITRNKTVDIFYKFQF